MSTKQNPISQQDKSPELKSDNSQNTKKALFKNSSNKNLNINTSMDEINKENHQSKNNKSQDNEEALLKIKVQKANLHKQKAQAFKQLKNIETEKIQAEVMLRKSHKKLAQIRNSPSIKKSQPVSVHKAKQNCLASNQLKESRNSNSFVVQNYSIVNDKKVYMSQEDVEKLKKLKDQYKNREHQLKKKVQAHELLIQKMKTQEFIQKERKIEEERQKRIKSIEQRQKITSKQRQQRFERYQQENRRLKQIKKSKKLFEKLEEQFHKTQQREKLNLDEMVKSRIGQGIVNYDEIKRHQKQYLEKNKENIENSRLKIKSKIKQIEEEFHKLNLHKSQFYQKVKNQKKEWLKKVQENQMRKRVCSEKIKEYKDVVRQNFMPTVFKAQKPQSPKKPQYNISEIHGMGNEYMKQGGRLIDRNKSLNILEKINQQEPEKLQKKTYKNYLHQNRTQASPQAKSKSKTQKQETMVERQLKQINSITNPKQKYQKIKLLHNKIQRDLRLSMQIGNRIKLKTGNADKKTKKESDEDIKRIKAKLQLLQGL